MSKHTKFILTALFIGLIVALAFEVRHAWSPRVVAHAVTPEGIELCVVQESGRDFPPFVTSFVFRKPGANWDWYYYDHEDWYWSAGQFSLDTNNRVATAYRAGEPCLTFNWNTEFYTLRRPDLFQTYKEAMHLSAGWAPGKRIE